MLSVHLGPCSTCPRFLSRSSDKIFCTHKPNNLMPLEQFRVPFAWPYEELDLYVDSWRSKRFPDEYSLLLNKFNVRPHHALLVTRSFVSQFTAIRSSDLEVTHEVLEALDGIGFYNAGKESGPSQPHRHSQVLPREGNALAFLPLLDAAAHEHATGSGPYVLPSLPYRHAAETISGPGDMFPAYLRCCEHAGVTLPEKMEDEITNSHNILMAAGWLVVVPRSCAEYDEITGNGLNFLGSFFFRKAELMEKIRAIGPFNALRGLGYPNHHFLR